MKKLILSLFACGAVVAANAQAGLLTYGSAGYSLQRGSNDNTTGGFTTSSQEPKIQKWNISPGIGWSLNNNLAVGIEFNYAGSRTENERPSPSPVGFLYEQRTRTIGVGPFIRHTVQFGEHFFAYNQLTVSYLNGKTSRDRSPNVSQEDNYDGVGARFEPAIGIRITPMVALSFGIGGIDFSYLKNDYDAPAGSTSERKMTNLDITMGKQFNLTIQRYCNWGHKARHGKGHRMPMDDTRKIDSNDSDE